MALKCQQSVNADLIWKTKLLSVVM